VKKYFYGRDTRLFYLRIIGFFLIIYLCKAVINMKDEYKKTNPVFILIIIIVIIAIIAIALIMTGMLD
jgi:hypothetical protein